MSWVRREGVKRGTGRQEFAAFTKDTCTFHVDFLRKKTKGKSKMKMKRKVSFFVLFVYKNVSVCVK